MPLKVFLVLQDLTKSQTGHTDEMSKVQRPAVFADINICLASAFSYQKRTLGLHEKEVTEAGKFVCLFYQGVVHPLLRIFLSPQRSTVNN